MATVTPTIRGRTRQIHLGLVRQLERLTSQTHHLQRDVAVLMVLCWEVHITLAGSQLVRPNYKGFLSSSKTASKARRRFSVVRDFRTVQLFATGGVLPRGSVNNLPVFGSCQRLNPGTLCASTRHCKQSLYVEPAGICGVVLPTCNVTQPQALHSRKYRLDLVMVIFCGFIGLSTNWRYHASLSLTQ